MITSFLLIIARNTAVPPGTGWFQVFVAVQFASYFIVFWSFGGQTPGMRAWSLQLRMRDGEPVPVRAAAARFLFGCLSFAAGGIGFLAIIRDPDRQTWHDRAVGTRLVYARSRDGHR